MEGRIRRHWRLFRDATPGKRFEEHYIRHQKASHGPLRRVLFVAGGVVLVLAGIVLLVAPGPGWLVIALGAAFIANESRAMARFLDRSELAMRRVAGVGMRFWRRASPTLRAVVVVLALGVAVGVGYGVFELVFD